MLEMGTVELTASQTLDLMKQYDCGGICWTYNDPTIWLEYTLEGAMLAKHHGYYTVYITNGFTTPEALDMIGPYLDAFRVDLKGFEPVTYKQIAGLGRVEKILEAAVRAKTRWGMHVECVTNVTPGINDASEELHKIARAIKTELGVDTPWHLTRFYPYLDLSHLSPTSLTTLERAVEIGREEGLWYVYMGNVPGHVWEDTYCHGCQTLLIKREGYLILENNLLRGRCPSCHVTIPGRFV
jgi:pyruvate formate lyase activating enzyme